MAHRFNISRYYITSEDDRRMSKFEAISGDRRYPLIGQYIRGFMARHRPYYIELARYDVKARGMIPHEWAAIVLKEGYKGLPPYLDPEYKPDTSCDPLANVELPDDCLSKTGNYIPLTRQNYILMQTLFHYGEGTQGRLIGLIIREHISRNWKNLYNEQIVANSSYEWLE